MDRPSVKDIIGRVEMAQGVVSVVARYYGRPRSTVQSWIDNSATATQALSDAREARVDMAEMVLFKKAASEENLSAVFYILNNDPMAKARGWGHKLELSHSGNINLTDLTDDELRTIAES